MKQPQGPQSPTFVQTLQWVFRPMSYMEECAKRYGDIFTLALGAKLDPLVLVSNPKALQQILTNDTTKQFTAPGDINGIFEPLTGKQSVFGLSGMQHQRQRQLMMPPFHGDRMRTYAETITKVTEEIMSRWQVGKSFCAMSQLDLELAEQTEIKAVRRGLVTAPNRSIQLLVKGERTVKSPNLAAVHS
jgi:cytochrome P450